jgi:translocation and assembly module TamB
MRVLHRSLILLAWSGAAVALLVAGLAVATAFPAGRAAIASLAARVGSAASGFELEIQSPDRLTPTRVDIERIRVAQQGETLIVVDGLKLRLRWADLLRGRLRPALVQADQVAIEALPPGDGAAEKEDGIRISLPLLPAETIRIDRLRLGPTVLGEAVELRIAATEVAAAGEHAVDVDLKRLDRPGDEVVAYARYRPDTQTLEIHASAAEAAGGLLGRQLGAAATASLRAELSGAGPLEAWRGKLAAAIDGMAAIEASLGIDRGVGAIVGEARIEPDLRPELAPLLREPLGYRARLRWTADEGLRIERAELRLADLRLGLTGTVAPDFAEVQLQGNADVPLATLSPLIGTPLAGTAGVLFHLTGPPARPVLAVELALTQAAAAGFGVDGGLIRVESRSERDGRYRARVTGSIASVSGLPLELAPLAAGPFYLGTLLDLAADAVRVESLALRGAALAADGDGVLRLGPGRSSGRLRVDATVPASGAGPVRDGRVVAQLAGAGELAAGSFQAEGDVRFEDLALAEDALGRLVGATPRLWVNLSGAAGSALRIERARAELAAFELGAEGTYDLAQDVLAVDVTAEAPDLAVFSALAGQSLAGRAQLTGRIAGPAGDPATQGRLTVTGLAVARRLMERSTLAFDLRQLVSEPRGHLAAEIRAERADYKLATDARLRGGTELALTKLTVGAPGLAGNGELTVDLAGLLTKGRISLDAADLGPAGALAGLALAGRAQATVRLDHANARQQVAMDLKGSGLRLQDISLGRVDGRVALSDVLGTPRGDVSATGSDLAAGAVTLKRWQVAGQGDLSRAGFEVSLAGEAGGPISARASGSAGLRGERWQVALRSLAAKHGEIDVALDSATELSGDGKSLRLAETAMTVGGTKLNLAAALADGRVDGHLRTGAFPLSLLRTLAPDLPVRGHVAVDASAAGSAAAPRVAGTVRSDDLHLARSETPIGIDLELALADGRLNGRARIGKLADQPLVATLAMPMRLSLQPWQLAWSPDDPIEARLDGKVDLARVLPPLIPDGDAVAGVAAVQMALSGTPSEPVVNGGLTMEGGRYENAVTEAVIRDLALTLAAEGNTLRISGRGSDGENGTVALDGRLALATADRAVGATLALRNFWVARRADAAIRMAGDLQLAGTALAPRLAGKLTIQQADLQLPEQLPPDVVKLDVVEINGPAQSPPADIAPAAGPSDPGLRIGLNLEVGADRRVFVRGRGLDSEWRGNLHVRGDTAAPDVSGTLEAFNGRLDFLGERFVLTKGKLMFPGGKRIDPDLDVATELTRGDLTAIVSVGGTMSKPELKLSARPDLPPEEVVSRILFQKGTAKLSPLQAVQVAQSVLNLTGRGGPGVVDRMRRATGLDVIDFEAGEGEGAAGGVSVGKYVSDNVLLRAEKGLDNTGPRAGIEVEVTPNISVESKVGGNASTSVGVKLKKDY